MKLKESTEKTKLIVSHAVICAAYDRGIYPTRIADLVGLARTSICRILNKNGRRPGKDGWWRSSPNYRRAGMVRRKCIFCNKIWFTSPSYGSGHYCGHYCSPKCMGKAIKIISDEEVVRVIEMRQSCMTWKQIGRALKHSHQTIQRSIWCYLHEQGKLNTAIVDDMWRTRGIGRPGRWNWLINSTGLTPTQAPREEVVALLRERRL
jgi:hypothetical protein